MKPKIINLTGVELAPTQSFPTWIHSSWDLIAVLAAKGVKKSYLSPTSDGVLLHSYDTNFEKRVQRIICDLE